MHPATIPGKFGITGKPYGPTHFLKTTHVLAGQPLSLRFANAQGESNPAWVGSLFLSTGTGVMPSVVEGASRARLRRFRFERSSFPHTNVRLPWHSFDEKTTSSCLLPAPLQASAEAGAITYS